MSKRVFAGEFFPYDQPVDLVGPTIGVRGLQI